MIKDNHPGHDPEYSHYPHMKQDELSGFLAALRYLIEESQKLDAPSVTWHLELALETGEQNIADLNKARSKLDKVHPKRLDDRQRPT